MPPSDMPLCHTDYFEMKTIGKQIEEKLSAFPPEAGHNCVNVSPPLSIPGWTEVRETTLDSYQPRDGIRIYIINFTN